ncbi:MAG: Crp/Fnr family transcriptional regulator [Chloroflexaceae bacterium]|nr:Crp/Fnr family transcriptional regulator [Chloroflexaceae bacterium]
MLTMAQLHDAIRLLPFLADTNAPLVQAFSTHTTLARIPAGTTIFEEGDVCSTFAVLAAGQVRVFTIGKTGREITLYRFERGESCILTTSCILSTQQFPAIATVEQAVLAYVVPHTVFQDWMNEHQAWRTYIFALLARRLATVMAVLDEVTFRRMDARIAEFLLRQMTAEPAVLAVTHQQIAAELGTSREVVSRILADFADHGMVQIARGTITVLDRAHLKQRSERH